MAQVAVSSTVMPALRHDTSAANIAAAKGEITRIVGASNIISDPDECFARSTNAWTPAAADQKPMLVALPASTEDVSEIMKICHSRIIPVTAISGGTSLPGALISTRGGICIDFQRMDKIVAVHREDMDAVVQPAVGWRQLNEALKRDNFFFPPDPSPDARIGGMIAMSCAGTNTYRYGTMKEWVIGLTVVLADGTVMKTRQRPRKSSAGYDLTHLIIGSEGTLGLVTEATIKLTVLPSNPHVAVATFPDNHTAVRASLSLVNSGQILDAIELLDHMSIKAINVSGLSTRHWDEVPTLFLKLSGSTSTVEDQIKFVKGALESAGSRDFEVTNDEDRMEVIWGARKIDGKATLSMKKDPSDVFIPSDAAVPISRVADLMDESYRLLEGIDMTGSITAHLGDGNLHVKIICAADQKAQGEAIIRQIEVLAIQMDGTCTGEHGVGLKLRDQLVTELGNDAVDIMRKIKLALDPNYILNCDKIFHADKKY